MMLLQIVLATSPEQSRTVGSSCPALLRILGFLLVQTGRRRSRSLKRKEELEWVNLSKRGGKDGVFRGLVGLLRGISQGQSPREIPRSSPASPRKTPSIPPLLLGLTHFIPFPMLLRAVEEAVLSHTKTRSRLAVQSVFCVAPCCPRGSRVPHTKVRRISSTRS